MQEFIGDIFQIMLSIIGILIGISLAILVPAFGYMWWRNRKLNAYYDVMWKKSSRLKPKDLLPWRGTEDHGFHKFYHLRQEDHQIEQRLSRGDHLLVIGNPLAGKTRAIYQALISSKKKYDVVIPKVLDVYNPLDIHIPSQFTRWRKRVLVLDDIDKFAAKQGFTSFLGEFIKKNVIILATCRKGIEYEMLCRSLERELEWFGKSVEISKLSKEEEQQVEQQLGKTLPERFDGNIGSIFVDIETMRQRFRDCTTEEKGILRSLKRLHAAGIYKGRELFSLERLKLACAKLEEIQKEKYEWRALIDSLTKNGFVVKVSERPDFMEKVEEQIQTEETYLEQVIEDDFSPLANLKEMLAIFAKNPDVLYDIGLKAREIGRIDLQKADYMKVSIEACHKALEVWNVDSFSENYAMTHNGLGLALTWLAEIKNKADNCRCAITAYQEALKVHTLGRFPMYYAMTQNNLGYTYRVLAEVEDTSINCKRAIIALNEALKVYTLDRFPIQYGATQNNLGNAYSILAGVENKAENCKRAITAYQEALKFYTLERFPTDYGMTQNNLGNAYSILAEVENKAENCKRAITAYQEALKVRTLERFPMDYGMTQNNLGNAYSILAGVENKTDNCRRAITAYQEALKVYTLERFPMQYGTTQNNLGNAFRTLAGVENKTDNCRRAITAYQEALKVRTLERLPMDYGMTQNNLGNAFSGLAEVENKADNCRRAIMAFQAALKVRTLDRFPIQYATTQVNLGNTYQTLAQIQDKAENCTRALKAYEEALEIFTKEEFPEVYAVIMSNLEILVDLCEGK